MSNLKRLIYGFPLMAPYREWRSRNLAQRHRAHHLGFQFAGAETFFSPSWEKDVRAAIVEQISNADVFLDIGANQGVYTCIAAQSGIAVVAVEPEQSNLRFLLGNIQANRFVVEVFPVALADSPGTAMLFGDGDTASLVSGWAAVKKSFAQLVPTNSLDNLFARRWSGKRLIVKMDVEGFESQVISGAGTILHRQEPTCWIIENLPRNYDADASLNLGFLEVFEAMFAAGYTCVLIGSNEPVDMAIAQSWFDDPTLMPNAGSNFLFNKA